MPNLSDKLKSLGVKVGARDIAPPTRTDKWPIDRVISGREYTTPAGEIYLVETNHPSTIKSSIQPEGIAGEIQAIHGSLEIISVWAGEPRIKTSPLPKFAFLDIETNDLRVGQNTYPFLVGIARYESDHLHLAQFFMRSPAEEPAHLLAIEEFLSPCEVLVTYNGKSFEASHLAYRYKYHGFPNPIANLPHLDLLHLCRRLWPDRLADRKFGSLETNILGLRRTEMDVPGFMIPEIYYEYMHTGDARLMEGVFYHNSMDVISMAYLLNHISQLLDDPLHAQIEHTLDLFAISHLYEDLGRWEEAMHLYRLVIERSGDEPPRQEAIRRLSMLYKRHGDWENALTLWQEAVEENQLYACEELAKYHEHYTRLLHEALHWTLTALDWLNSPECPSSQKLEWLPEFQYRLERLKRKISA